MLGFNVTNAHNTFIRCKVRNPSDSCTAEKLTKMAIDLIVVAEALCWTSTVREFDPCLRSLRLVQRLIISG
jgi:hypothetical protein